MINIIGQELKKIMLLPYIKVWYISICCLVLIITHLDHQTYLSFSPGNKKMYRNFEDKLTYENYNSNIMTLNSILDKYPVGTMIPGKDEHLISYGEEWVTGSDYGDLIYYQWFSSEAQRMIDFNSRVDEDIRVQEEKIDFFKSVNFDSVAKQISKNTDSLKKRGLSRVAYLEGIKQYFYSNVGSYVSILTAIFLAVKANSIEYESGMIDILSTISKSNRFTNVSKKIGLSLILTLSTVLLEGIIFLYYYFFDYISGFSVPIYQISELSSIYLNTSILTALFLHIVLKVMFVLLVGNWISYLTKSCKSQMVGFVLGAGVLSLILLTPLSNLVRGIVSYDLQFVIIVLLSFVLSVFLMSIKRVSVI